MGHLNAILLPAFVLVLSHCVLCSTSTESIVNSSSSTTTLATPMTTKVPDVRQKWKDMESFLKKTSSMMVKSVLPELVRSSQEIEISANCSRSLMKLLTGIKQLKLWAFQMLDASGKIPEGILRGTYTTTGDYDTCLDVEVPGNFRGQFCNLDFKFPLPERERFVPAFKILKELKNLSHPDNIINDFATKARYYYRGNIRAAVCIPSTCSASEVEKIASKIIEKSGLDFNLSSTSCTTKEDKVVFSTSEIVIIVVLSFLLLTCITGTIVDVLLKIRSEDESYQRNLSVPLKLLMCFSFYTNFRRLLKKDNSPDSIKIFYGMKTVTMLWVILNHTYVFLSFQMMKSPLMHAGRHKEFGMMIMINGYINVESFFFMSAVLLAYGTMKSKEKNINIFSYVFRRVWRLAPPFMFVIACVFLIPHLGSGPVWKEMVVEELTEKCQKTWWTNLLFINNLFTKKTMCLHWLWYIPADTHLYFLSLLVMIPLKRNPKLAFTINVLIFVLCITVTAVIHVVQRLAPTGIFIYIVDEDINEYLDNHYFRSWVHCSSYTVGLTIGYLLASKKKVHIPLKFNILGWVTAFFFGLLMVYGSFDWNVGNVPGVFISTLFVCTHKLLWSLALGWITFVCVTGNSNAVSSFLSWGGFVPLGRLTYMTYLIHPIVQHMYMGSLRTLYTPDHRTMVFDYVAYVGISFMCACVLSMMFESPFLSLEKVLMSIGGRKRPRSQSTPKNHEVEFGQHEKHNGIPQVNGDNGVYTINVKQIENDR